MGTLYIVTYRIGDGGNHLRVEHNGCCGFLEFIESVLNVCRGHGRKFINLIELVSIIATGFWGLTTYTTVDQEPFESSDTFAYEPFQFCRVSRH